jgi:hypothetical protein
MESASQPSSGRRSDTKSTICSPGVATAMKDGAVVARDDLGRPKLKIWPHDFGTAFAEIFDRHGGTALEAT